MTKNTCLHTFKQQKDCLMKYSKIMLVLIGGVEINCYHTYHFSALFLEGAFRIMFLHISTSEEQAHCI